MPSDKERFVTKGEDLTITTTRLTPEQQQQALERMEKKRAAAKSDKSESK